MHGDGVGWRSSKNILGNLLLCIFLLYINVCHLRGTAAAAAAALIYTFSTRNFKIWRERKANGVSGDAFGLAPFLCQGRSFLFHFGIFLLFFFVAAFGRHSRAEELIVQCMDTSALIYRKLKSFRVIAGNVLQIFYWIFNHSQNHSRNNNWE